MTAMLFLSSHSPGGGPSAGWCWAFAVPTANGSILIIIQILSFPAGRAPQRLGVWFMVMTFALKPVACGADMSRAPPRHEGNGFRLMTCACRYAVSGYFATMWTMFEAASATVRSK